MSEWKEYSCFIFHRPSYRGRKFRYKQYNDAFEMTWSISKGGRKNPTIERIL